MNNTDNKIEIATQPIESHIWKNDQGEYFVDGEQVSAHVGRTIELVLQDEKRAIKEEFVHDALKNISLVEQLSPPSERTSKLREYFTYKLSPSERISS